MGLFVGRTCLCSSIQRGNAVGDIVLANLARQ